jgi:type II secretory pathway pseudopilin PulG
VKRGGFSLVESVFSISLIALVVMVVLNLFPMASIAGHRAHQQSQAQSFAQVALENARAGAFEDLKLGNITLPSQMDESLSYTLTQTVYVPSGEDANTLKGVRIHVSWRDRNTDHHLDLEEYLGNIQR